jgi:cell wall assembly regulator SMI1
MKAMLQKMFPSLLFEGGAGASVEEVASLESKLAIRLPRDYRVYLNEFGWLEVDHYEFFGIGVDIPSYLNLQLVVPEEWSAGLPKTLLPIWNNGGGDLDCIDLRSSGDDVSTIVCYRHATAEIEFVASDVKSWLCEKLNDVVT